jgi:hypothetical protein
MNKLSLQLLVVLLTGIVTPSLATTYYVSYVSGNDVNTGTTLASPFKTITKAVAVAVAGDIIYLRGEVHSYAAKINISKTGTAGAKFYLLAYPGDATRPVLDFSAMTVNSSNRGVDVSGSFWVFKGFDIYKAGDNGMHVNGSNNIVEFCAFYENADTGLQLDNGASNNQMINCDSYYNIDPAEGNADGFAVKLNVGTGNSFRGCRAWQNSDDGWDGLLNVGLGTNPSTTYDSCWVFLNGYRKNMTLSLGNGNGFKMGGNQELHDVVLRNCLAVYNREKGFDQNNNKGSMILYNCTGYKNGRNYGMNNYDPAAGEEMVIKNSVSYLGTNTDVFRTVAVRTNNSWQSPFVVTAADFASLDTAVLRAPRNADGSLPAISLMKLAQGSDLIDGGTNVGLPYYGSAPDVGYAESNYPMPVHMLSFTASIVNKDVLLKWSTATEIQNTGWDIERFIPGMQAWQKIGFIEGKGNSTAINHYGYVDVNAVQPAYVLYRLKQVDQDGRATYSNIITVKFSEASASLNSFPNPTKDFATIRFHLPRSGEVHIALLDALGKSVRVITNEKVAAGNHFAPVNLAALPKGQYIIRLVTNGETFTTILVKSQ